MLLSYHILVVYHFIHKEIISSSHLNNEGRGENLKPGCILEQKNNQDCKEWKVHKKMEVFQPHYLVEW